MSLIDGKNGVVEEVMDNTSGEERQPHKKFKKNSKTAEPNFGSSLLKILENRQVIPEDPEKSFLMSLLPQIKSLDEDKKTQLYVKFLNAIQRVKNSSVTPAYPYNTPNNQPYSAFFPQQYYAPNNYPQNVSSSVSNQRPPSHQSYFNIPPQYTPQNVPNTRTNSTITSLSSVLDESSNFSQSPPPEINYAQKHNYYNVSNMQASPSSPQNISTPPTLNSYENNYVQPTSPYIFNSKKK